MMDSQTDRQIDGMMHRQNNAHMDRHFYSPPLPMLGDNKCYKHEVFG